MTRQRTKYYVICQESPTKLHGTLFFQKKEALEYLQELKHCGYSGVSIKEVKNETNTKRKENI